MTCGKTAMELHDEARVLRLIQTKHESVVRELEAAVEHNAQIGAEMTREAHRQESRAEKTESDGRLLAKMLDDQNEKLHKAEARVAELERLIAESNAKIPMPYIGPWDPCQTGDDGAREREAE